MVQWLEPRQMLAAVIGATNTVDQASAFPGDTLTYTVTISNTGDASATGVTFNDTFDPETTFVDGSITVTPIGFDDVYGGVIGNTLLTVNTANGVLANDIDPDDPGAFAGGRLEVKAGSVSRVSGTVSGSTLNVAADGSFTYNPGVGLTGTERFQYTVTDDDNLDSVTLDHAEAMTGDRASVSTP